MGRHVGVVVEERRGAAGDDGDVVDWPVAIVVHGAGPRGWRGRRGGWAGGRSVPVTAGHRARPPAGCTG